MSDRGSEGKSSSHVEGWLRGVRDDDVRSVVTGVGDSGTVDGDAVRAELDDVMARLQVNGARVRRSSGSSAASSVGDEREATRGAAEVGDDGGLEHLADVADREQRSAVVQLLAQMRRGRDISGPDVSEAVRRMKRFSPSENLVLDTLEDAREVCARIASGDTVVASVMARTGMGKTTRLPAKVANEGRARVLLLQTDEAAAKDTRPALASSVSLTRRTSPRRTACVRVMSYYDFNRMFWTTNGGKLLAALDVVIMDESHIPKAEEYAARAILATFSPHTLSILSLTATDGVNDVQSVAASGDIVYVEQDLFQAVEAGKFDGGAAARDLTLLLFPTDEKVGKAAQRLSAVGYTVFSLDSVSTPADVTEARAGMSGSGTSVRFLVAHEKYGTSWNFPLRYVHTTASRVVDEFDGNTVVQREVSLTVPEVKQHCGRVGRSIVKGAGAFVYRGEDTISAPVPLMASEKLKAFLLLKAAFVEPLPALLPADDMFPFGVTPAVAADMLRTGLPPAVASRFFAADGRMPARFARAFGAFTHESYFMSSKYEQPLHADRWVEDQIGDYYGSPTYSSVIRVPFFMTGALRARVHSICGFADRMFNLEVWHPRADDSGSDTESVVESTGRAWLPRKLVTAAPVVREKPLPMVPYAYDVPLDEQFGNARSRGGVYAPLLDVGFTRMIDSVETVKDRFDAGYTISAVDGVSRVHVVAAVEPSPIEVQSPGGNVIASIRASTYAKMMDGEALDGPQVRGVLSQVKRNVTAFANSDVFAYWGNAWLSVLKTFHDKQTLEYVSRHALHSVAVTLLLRLYDRYCEAVGYVVQNSQVKAKFWDRVVKRGFDGAVRHAEKSGKTVVMQSKEFYRRVYDIRVAFAEAWMTFEGSGVFPTSLVDKIRGLLPISRTIGNRVVDDRSARSRRTR